jgi:RIO kinase 3
VPEVVVLKQHVLVMSFVGSEGRAAPKLKEAVLRMSKAEVAKAYEQIEEMMVKLYNTCHLVHADLSEYNILWFNSECWFIDVRFINYFVLLLFDLTQKLFN